jgi:superfamily II DNA or RNA helicase
MQLSLLGDQESTGTDASSTLVLRDYQELVAGEALSYLSQRRSPLSVLATGGGKTRIAAHVVRHYTGRVLWIAHRIELVKQGIEALEQQLGELVDSETVTSYSAHRRVVVASKDTIRTPRRLERLKNYGGFDLIVIDEAHHSSANSYWSILNAYPNALRYGLTATPGRLDKRPLAAFDCATTPFGMVELQERGWLVPIRAKRVKVETIDLSGVKTVAGDFNQSELDAIYKSEANLHAIAKAILDRMEAGPCLHFATSVDVAERQTEVLNRYRPGVARFVSGKTPDEERRLAFAGLGKTHRVLVNVGVATEGTDLPATAIVSIGRPTKSTALFQQMLGRGLRPLSGIVDNHGTAQERLGAIARSIKPHCLVLDFVGTTGRHSIATAPAAFTADQDAPSAVSERLRERLESGEELDLAGALAEELAAEQDRLK